MTTAKELLEQATPLPWRVRTQGGTFARAVVGGDGRGWVVGEIRNVHDAALAVYAVNRLPDYEAAVDALAGIVENFDAWKDAYERPSQRPRMSVLGPDVEHARAALARLRGAS